MPEGLNRTFRVATLCGVAMLCGAAGLIPGCVTEQRGNNKLPDKQPDWVRPARLLVAIQLPEDTDANGYLDTIPLTVYLFDEKFPLAIARPGAFTFRLRSSASGKEIGIWKIDAATAQKAIRKMRPGPGYQFRLDVRDFGADTRDSGTVDLTAEFMPSSGANPATGNPGGEGSPASGPSADAPVRGAAATTFRLGRAGADR